MASFIDTNVPPHGSLMMSLPIRTQFTTAANEITQLQNRVSVLEQSPSGGDTNWGDLTGSIADQTDLYDWLNDLQPRLISGQNIATVNGYNLLASGNIQITAEGGGTVTSVAAGNGIATNPPSGITHTGYVSLAPLSPPPPSGPITNATVTVDQYGRVISAVAGAPPGETAPATWGTITGTLASQTDLNTALNNRQPLLVWTGGSANIRTVGGQSLQGPGDISLPEPGPTSVAFSAITGQPTENTALNTALNARQPLLVWTGGSANIRTVGGQSLQGPGDIPLPAPGAGSVAFSAITGQPTDNTALNTALNARQPLLVWTGGSANIRTVGGQSLQGPGDIPLPEPGAAGGVNIGEAGTAALGRDGPPLLQIRNTNAVLPPPNTQLGFIRVEGVANTSPLSYGHGFEIQVRVPSAMGWSGSSRGTIVQFIAGRNNSINPAIAFSIGAEGGLFMGGASDTGAGSVNALAYFVNGQTLRQWILNTFQVEEW